MGEVILSMDYLEDVLRGTFCRICHEEEFESCKNMESPCSCSGTVKYAHRDCIQRWCDEKGNTICEICLQKFEPNYTAAPKTPQQVNSTGVTIRRSLEIPGSSPIVMVTEEALLETGNQECVSAADRTAIFCRSLAIAFTIALLIRHLFSMCSEIADEYPFSLATLVIMKVGGIVVPMYIFTRIITAVQTNISHSYQFTMDDHADSEIEDYESNSEDEDIQS
ncbi:ERAD-associated E3 ubiquitin-protein ligase doa10-like [Impatiens glandulifera]|uniref:ERAD-associated E3 ubiquitin-protein ligase doa10-like n=1 Tax=Impatiens glandulifera TaxID=253017 RepID=UPI001FB1369B|nr:ERAD-associated E3 ubiquitin-protein ligase doa10-like [Impatiens glandulifera]